MNKLAILLTNIKHKIFDTACFMFLYVCCIIAEKKNNLRCFRNIHSPLILHTFFDYINHIELKGKSEKEKEGNVCANEREWCLTET